MLLLFGGCSFSFRGLPLGNEFSSLGLFLPRLFVTVAFVSLCRLFEGLFLKAGIAFALRFLGLSMFRLSWPRSSRMRSLLGLLGLLLRCLSMLAFTASVVSNK
ncbi:MAG: hypothetical protein ACREX4_20675 [Gammaproteobacteria bacterium]